MSLINEHDEQLLNRLLDGELSADEAANLQRRIEQEPALRAAWERLTRINALLIERRANRCEVNWGRFHASAMSRIAKEAAPAARIIRFPRWLKVVTPLAAAAAVAIVVVLSVPYAERKPAESDSGVIRVVYDRPALASADTPGKLVVSFHRPAATGNREASAPEPIHVAYSRSSELEEQIRRADAGRENQPSSHLYIMRADNSASDLGILSDPPPL